jgi:hypothetical protein
MLRIVSFLKKLPGSGRSGVIHFSWESQAEKTLVKTFWRRSALHFRFPAVCAAVLPVPGDRAERPSQTHRRATLSRNSKRSDQTANDALNLLGGQVLVVFDQLWGD